MHHPFQHKRQTSSYSYIDIMHPNFRCDANPPASLSTGPTSHSYQAPSHPSSPTTNTLPANHPLNFPASPSYPPPIPYTDIIQPSCDENPAMPAPPPQPGKAKHLYKKTNKWVKDMAGTVKTKIEEEKKEWHLGRKERIYKSAKLKHLFNIEVHVPEWVKPGFIGGRKGTCHYHHPRPTSGIYSWAA